jgi:chaperone modulatory protein CbpM
MMRLEAVTQLFADLDVTELRGWIAQRWVQPDPGGEDIWVFQEIDIARVRLIYDLRRSFDTSEEAVPMVLSLVDQLYELRCRLRAVMQAVDRQPAEVREAVASALKKREA